MTGAYVLQSMRRTLSSVVSGVGSMVSGVGNLSAAVSTTMLHMATEDEDLAEFGDPDFATDLRGRLDRELRTSKRSKKRNKDMEVSVDSGVATDPLHDVGPGLEEEGGPSNMDRVSSTSSISVSSVEEEFMQGLSFVGLHHVEHVSGGREERRHVAADEEFFTGLSFNEGYVVLTDVDQESSSSAGGKDESSSSAGGKDEMTHVTDDDDIVLTTSDSDSDAEFSLGTVDITATEIFLARNRNQSAESRTLGRSLNHSGNLADFRRSHNDISLTPRPISSTPRSKSTTTLSPLSTEESTRKNPSLDTIRTRNELMLNTIRENENQAVTQRSVQFNNYIEMSHHDPTTIESFESSSGEEVDNPDLCNTMSVFDEDDDLLEKKDPFRESFNGARGGAGLLTAKPATVDRFSPTNCVKRRTLQNFNVGPGPSGEGEALDHSVIETISEISNRSQKSCSIGRKTPVKLKPLPKINAHLKSNTNTNRSQVRQVTSEKKTLPLQNQVSEESLSKTRGSPTSPKRKNYLAPPSQKKKSGYDTLNRFKESSRSLTQRSTSCTNLNSRTEEPLTRSGTLDGFNSLDKTRSFADLTYTPGNFPTESSPTVDVAEKSVTLRNSSLIVSHVVPAASSGSTSSAASVDDSYNRGRSNTESTTSSTFYSFSSEEPEPPQVILNGKSSKSFMMSMRTSFKRLTSFLSLSRSKKEKDITPKVPVPPPQHTKPDATTVGKYRQCVRPASPSLAREFSQRSKSCGNLQVSNSVKQEATGTKYRLQENDSPFRGADVDKQPKQNTVTSNGSSPRKKLAPPSSLISHITNHYTKPAAPARFGSSNAHGFGSLSRSKAPRQSTPTLYKSSPGTLLPSPPTQRKPAWRETKASRLRLNRVKAPSMSTLHF